jgi:hypothetical protein
MTNRLLGNTTRKRVPLGSMAGERFALSFNTSAAIGGPTVYAPGLRKDPTLLGGSRSVGPRVSMAGEGFALESPNRGGSASPAWPQRRTGPLLGTHEIEARLVTRSPADCSRAF